MKKKSLSAVMVLFILVVVFGLLNSVYIVPEGEYAYLTQFGAIVKTDMDAGLKFKIPFVQEVNRLTKRQMVYDVNTSEVLTADKKAMVVDSYAVWKIDNVTTFYSSVGNINEMQKRIDASIYSVIKNLMGSLQQNEIITDEESSRATLNEQITQIVRNQLEPYGISIEAVEIKRYDLPTDNLEAVYNRMISERQQMAAAFKADGEYEAAIIRNETDKEIEIILGEARAQADKLSGEAEEQYMQILQSIYNDPDKASFYIFVRELEALEISLGGADKTIVLGPDSPLVKILNQTTSASDLTSTPASPTTTP